MDATQKPRRLQCLLNAFALCAQGRDAIFFYTRMRGRPFLMQYRRRVEKMRLFCSFSDETSILRQAPWLKKGAPPHPVVIQREPAACLSHSTRHPRSFYTLWRQNIRYNGRLYRASVGQPQDAENKVRSISWVYYPNRSSAVGSSSLPQRSRHSRRCPESIPCSLSHLCQPGSRARQRRRQPKEPSPAGGRWRDASPPTITAALRSCSRVNALPPNVLPRARTRARQTPSRPPTTSPPNAPGNSSARGSVKVTPSGRCTSASTRARCMTG